jgi:hypothetical protein
MMVENCFLTYPIQGWHFNETSFHLDCGDKSPPLKQHHEAALQNFYQNLKG